MTPRPTPYRLTGIFAAALLVLSAMPITWVSAEEPPYPATTRFFRPFTRTGMVVAPNRRGSSGASSRQAGGELSGGVRFTSTGIGPVEGFVTGGYRAISDGERAQPTPFLGVGGGYGLTVGGLVGLLPAAGIHLALSVSNGAPVLTPEFATEITTRVHLYARNYLTLHTSLIVPAASSATPLVSVGFGLERSHPVMVPLPAVEPIIAVGPRRFSPDGDGENDILEVRVDTRAPRSAVSWALRIYDPRSYLFYEERGTGVPPETVTWDGRADTGEIVSSASTYTLEFSVTDRVGRTEVLRDEILVDILVTREDGRLKIRIPSITFPPDSADFGLLTDEEAIETNREVLHELAGIFSTFPEYSILIEGHANMQYYDNAQRGREEQEEVLIPLSRGRAEAVKDQLVELGIEETRITTVGIGADSPLVSFADEQNRWKNRRVEFILVRPSEEATTDQDATP